MNEKFFVIMIPKKGTASRTYSYEHDDLLVARKDYHSRLEVYSSSYNIYLARPVDRPDERLDCSQPHQGT